MMAVLFRKTYCWCSVHVLTRADVHLMPEGSWGDCICTQWVAPHSTQLGGHSQYQPQLAEWLQSTLGLGFAAARAQRRHCLY